MNSLVDEPAFETNNMSERIEMLLAKKFHWAPWTKFFRRNFLIENNIRLPEVTVSDDIIWTFQIICLANRVLRIPSALYVYRKNSQSVLRRNYPPEQELRHWLNPLIHGVDYLNEFMDEFDLFNRSDNLRLQVLNFFARIQFDFMARAFKTLELYKVYKIFSEEVSKRKGDHTALISYLLVMTNLY